MENRVYQLEFDGPMARLKGSSHNASETDWSFPLDNENFDIQGLGLVAMYLNRRGEEYISVIREGFGRTKDDRRYIIVTRIVAEPIAAPVPESAGQQALRKALAIAKAAGSEAEANCNHPHDHQDCEE